MLTNDIINGAFEILSGAFTAINIQQLVKDKTLKGVSWIPTGFFTLWGAWNLYFYSSLGLTISFIGSISIFVANMIWLGLVFYYKHRPKRQIYKENFFHYIDTNKK